LLIFVYGTLMRGEIAEKNLVGLGARFIKEVETAFKYDLLCVSPRDMFPYPTLVKGFRSIMGELWEVNETILASLDVYEGVPRLYTREKIELRNGDKATAYMATEGLKNYAKFPRITGDTIRFRHGFIVTKEEFLKQLSSDREKHGEH